MKIILINKTKHPDESNEKRVKTLILSPTASGGIFTQCDTT